MPQTQVLCSSRCSGEAVSHVTRCTASATLGTCCCAGAGDVQLADPLSSTPQRLADQRIRAASDLAAAKGDWDAAAALLQDAVSGGAARYWALGGYGWAALQRGQTEVRAGFLGVINRCMRV